MVLGSHHSEVFAALPAGRLEIYLPPPALWFKSVSLLIIMPCQSPLSLLTNRLFVCRVPPTTIYGTFALRGIALCLLRIP